MKKYIVYLFLLLFATVTYAQELTIQATHGRIIVPNSSQQQTRDHGLRAHTNYLIYRPRHVNVINGLPDGETPASLACIYGFTRPIPGCPISQTSALPTGGWGAIALVDAYDNPNAENDLNVFSAAFGLPPCTTANGCFQQVYAAGTPPPHDSDWAIEEALDIEWAHAMAPNAKIILVEANSNNDNDLFQAEDVASSLVTAAGGGQVSNSWGGAEYPEEISLDSHFLQPGIVYLASSGDYGAPANYPASSPNVVSAGGTSILRKQGYFTQETGWSINPLYGDGSSGGPSLYEPRPAYQNFAQRIVGNSRGTPDIAFDANPETGVDVYTTEKGGWIIVGGTSVSSPSLAGILNVANARANSTQEELFSIYRHSLKNYASFWHDILIGNNGYACLSGYDFVTGLGSVSGYRGK